eukprot:g39266.t1
MAEKVKLVPHFAERDLKAPVAGMVKKRKCSLEQDGNELELVRSAHFYCFLSLYTLTYLLSRAQVATAVVRAQCGPQADPAWRRVGSVWISIEPLLPILGQAQDLASELAAVAIGRGDVGEVGPVVKDDASGLAILSLVGSSAGSGIAMVEVHHSIIEVGPPAKDVTLTLLTDSAASQSFLSSVIEVIDGSTWKRLDQPLSLDKLTKVLNSFEKNKTPGCDSLPAELYSALWGLTGQDLLE